MKNIPVNYDGRSVIINKKRILFLAGSVHYPRVMPFAWRDIIRKSKKAGLNCIDTYVFWEGHEPEEGEYIFSGRYDLQRFLEICQSEGMYVILRIGPYICAEWNFGGLPWWLTTKKGLVTRTWNKPFMNAVKNWMQVLMAKISQYQATQGGPIIFIQMENEYDLVGKRYGKEGKKYLNWIADMAKDAGVEVPIIMCVGAAKGIIGTLNGFSVWRDIERHRKRFPEMPVLWTEDWPGWYDTWGNPYHSRDAKELAYEVLRFFAMGGAGVNYYMWHGGTNFGRDAMFLQTTSYDFDAPIDEYGLPTRKYEHLKRLHLALLKYQDILLKGKFLEKVDGIYLYIWKKGDRSLLFLINGGPDSKIGETGRLSYDLPGFSGILFLQDKKGIPQKLFATWELPSRISRKMIPYKKNLSWNIRKEVLPFQLPMDTKQEKFEFESPRDGLFFTRDRTDYMWYETIVNTSKSKTTKLILANVGDRAALWVNGIYMGVKPDYLQENNRTDFKVEFYICLKKGRNRLTILISALGLIKGDWMIDAPMSEEKKGLWGDVFLAGKKIEADWTLEIGLQGERIRCFEPEVASILQWEPISKKKGLLYWYKTDFVVSSKELSDPAPWAVCIGKLKKGFIWVNGFALGRYWQLPSKKEVPDDYLGKGHIIFTGIGEPPQIYYHIPREIIKKYNTLVIFDEEGASPKDVCIVRRR